jgi:uncharacterized RDD family membrane protein YckC
LWRVLKRNLRKWIDMGTFGLASIGVALSNPLRQSIGDLWAGTMVVETSRYAAWRAQSGETFDDWMSTFRKPTPPPDPQ